MNNNYDMWVISGLFVGFINFQQQLCMNNNSKREINFFSRWRVTRYRKATSTPLQLWKYANFTKPVFCLFLNHWINFWIVVRVFRVQLGLICVRQIHVWPYLSVQDIDEQWDFLNRMDLVAIFQQINLQYQWTIWVSAVLTLNRLDVCTIFFSFKYTSSLSTSQSCAKTPLPDSIACFFDPQQSFGNPLCTFWQYLASPVLEKSRFFSATEKFFSLICEDLCDASLGFGRLGQNPAGGEYWYDTAQ